MKRILFQGDSITDCGRNRNDFHSMGGGYPKLVMASLGMDRPGEYEFINRGISGNRVVDLYARIKADLINLAPDVLSIYIGVNDTWHEFGNKNGVDTPKFEKIYSMLIDEVQEACPQVKIMLIAPYVLRGTGTDNTENHPDRFEKFAKDVADKAEATKRLAAKYGFPVIDLQKAFDEACEEAPPSYWTADGVHPTPCGHEIIKRLWLKTFEEMK